MRRLSRSRPGNAAARSGTRGRPRARNNWRGPATPSGGALANAEYYAERLSGVGAPALIATGLP